MITTTIRTTCATCQLTSDVRATSLILALPSPSADPAEEPTFTHICAGCQTSGSTSIPWRAAAHLLEAGVTAVTATDMERIRPTYPERRPANTTPMTLDDLLDLHTALDNDVRAL